jgi:hypothetical protein
MALRNHRVTHFPAEWLHCPNRCSATFVLACNLAVHVLTCGTTKGAAPSAAAAAHSSSSSSVAASSAGRPGPVPAPGASGRVHCPECPLVFSSEKYTREHVLADHRGMRWVCPAPACGASFSRSTSLGKHIKSFHKGMRTGGYAPVPAPGGNK